MKRYPVLSRLGCAGFVAASLSFTPGAFAQGSAPEEINMRIGTLLVEMQAAEPYSVAQDALGLELIEVVVLRKAEGISEETIDHLAQAIGDDSSHVRVFVSHVLRELGPRARRALAALQKAAAADEQDLKERYGVTPPPDGPYEAERKAIDAINGRQPPR